MDKRRQITLRRLIDHFQSSAILCSHATIDKFISSLFTVLSLHKCLLKLGEFFFYRNSLIKMISMQCSIYACFRT